MKKNNFLALECESAPSPTVVAYAGVASARGAVNIETWVGPHMSHASEVDASRSKTTPHRDRHRPSAQRGHAHAESRISGRDWSCIGYTQHGTTTSRDVFGPPPL